MMATLDVSGSAPPIPSIWRASGEPITLRSIALRTVMSAGNSSARKKPPFDVPPRIHMQDNPSDIFEPLSLKAVAHVIDV